MMTTSLKRLRAGAFAAVFAALALSGCSTMDRSVALATDPVVPVAVGEASAVSAFDLASAMLRAGFTKDDILKYGPEVHKALAGSGGAQVRVGKVVAAMFAVHGDGLYVTSRTRGTFVQPIGGTGAG
jgi:hypothetical protein